MKATRLSFFAYCSILLILAGCSTPAAVKDSAAHSVALIAEMETQLKSFRAAQSRSEQYLLASVKNAREEAAFTRLALAPDFLAAEAAGRMEYLAIRDRMLKLLKGLDVAEQRYAAELQQSSQDTAKLLAPLPSTVATTTATQAALAEMTRELSPEVRIKEARALISAVKKSVEDNKKLIDDAEKKAAETPK